MVKKCKGRSRPMPDAGTIKAIAYKLEEALQDEDQRVSGHEERKLWEAGVPARDAAVQAFRTLKMWFGLPQTVFFSAVSHLDLFLARMKVQERYMACLSVACFHLAAAKHGCEVDAGQLLRLLQCKCTVRDVERMCKIVTGKLGRLMDAPNVFDLLNILLDIFTCIAVQNKTHVLLNRMLKFKEICLRVEVLMCNSACASYKSSALALAFVELEMTRFLSPQTPKRANYYTRELLYMLVVMCEVKMLSKINSNEYAECLATVADALKEYDNMKRLEHCQKLNWQFSKSTYALTKPSHSFYSMLNTIRE